MRPSWSGNKALKRLSSLLNFYGYSLMDLSSFSTQSLIQPWVERYCRLNWGDASTWSELYHANYTFEIAKMWDEIDDLQLKSVCSELDWAATDCKVTQRTVKRALQTLIHLKDGRLCTMLEHLSEAVDAHPNPFALRALMAQVEYKVASLGPRQDTEEEQIIRALAFA